MIKNLPIALEEPDNYAARAEIMWAGTIAHNGLLGTGRAEDWASHMIGHEISAIYDLTHGATLSIVFPAWMEYVYLENIDRFVQYSTRVWNVEMDYDNPEMTALEGIRKTKEFFKKIGMPTSLSEANIPGDKIEEWPKSVCYQGRLEILRNYIKMM